MDRSRHIEISSLEAALLKMVSDHNESSMKLREHTDKAKKDAIRIATRFSNLLVDTVNGGVQEAFIMEKRIEMETRAVAAAILLFGKQTDQWLSASHTVNTAIKDAGVMYKDPKVLLVVQVGFGSTRLNAEHGSVISAAKGVELRKKGDDNMKLEILRTG